MAFARDHTPPKGIGFLLAEGGIPRRIKAAHLTDEQAYALADTAAVRRRDVGQSRGTQSGGESA